MKKFFIALGVIFLVLVVLGAIGIGYIAFRGNTLDKEGKAYADAAIPAIVTSWDKKELLDRASPEFKRDVNDAQIDQLFHRFTVLGRFMTFDSATGQAFILATPQTGKVVTADYQAKAYFEKGPAMIKLKLIKHGDQWQILTLNVASPQLNAIGTAFADDTLDKESKAYADVAIPAIVTKWSKKELLDRASPEFNQAVTPQQLDQLFHRFAGFGHLKKREPAQGHVAMSATNQGGKQIEADYHANVTFDKGRALIELALIKHGDQWQILGFSVKPPQTVPK
jgi:stress response protein SCP2